jgi:hypothetical protein
MKCVLGFFLLLSAQVVLTSAQTNAKLLAANKEVIRRANGWHGRAVEIEKAMGALQTKCDTFQTENVKLYEDNGKLVTECESLRAQLSVYEEMRGKDGAELLRQYAMLAGQYQQAVRHLQTQNQARPAAAAPPQASIRPPGEYLQCPCRNRLLIRRQWSPARYLPSYIRRPHR